MDLLIARQPILNVKQETVAYELLFRNGTGNAFSGDVDGETATFELEVTPKETGRLGYAVRVSPNHYEDPMTRPVTSMIKWANR